MEHSGEGKTSGAFLAASVCAFLFCLASLTLVNVYDADFGFYLACGREILAHGIPQHEFYLPLLKDEPFTSQWLLSAAIFASVWDHVGVWAFVILKALCYAGGFLFVAMAAVKRGVTAPLAFAVAGLLACAVSNRFVERPGFFSALFMGALICLYSRDRSFKITAPATLVIFTLWPFLHAEWLIGFGLLISLLWSAKGCMLHRIAVATAALGIPFFLFALIHPSGIRPLLAPLSILVGGAGDFHVREYKLEAWTQMPGAIAAWVLLAAAAAWLLHRRRFPEGLFLTILLILCLKVSRTILPAAIIGAPALGQMLQAALSTRSWERSKFVAAACILTLALAGPPTRLRTPWRQTGLGLDPRFDCRGIAMTLDRIAISEGSIFTSDFGWSSVLLSQPAAVRQGIIMDGRQEAYSKAYLDQVFAPLFDNGAGWPERVEKRGIAFYFEPYTISSESSLSEEFRALHWPIAAWDESGVLYVRPDLIKKYGMETFRYDAVRPSRSGAVTKQEIAAIREEVHAHAEYLAAQHFPIARAKIAEGILAAAMGDDDAAEVLLNEAKEDGGDRYPTWWRAEADLLQRLGRFEEAAAAQAKLE